MFGYNTIERPPAIEGIKIIDELLTEEQKALLTLKMGQREITPLKQLKALYEGLYCLYTDLDEFECAAASIINKQLLDFKKLETREQTLADQAKIESYYQVSDRLEKGAKGIGMKGSANGGTNNVSMNILKNREGQAQYSKEFNIDQVWDQQNFEQLNLANSLQDKHGLAKNWEFEEKQPQVEGDLTKYIAKEVEDPKKPAAKPEEESKTPELTQPPTSEDEDEDMSVKLNTININSQSNLNFTKNNSYSETGKRVESNKTNKTITTQYTKGRAIRAFQEAQEAAIRERIFARFEVLFTNRRCQ